MGHSVGGHLSSLVGTSVVGRCLGLEVPLRATQRVVGRLEVSDEAPGDSVTNYPLLIPACGGIAPFCKAKTSKPPMKRAPAMTRYPLV
jgi:hypothetical protein